MNLVDIYDLDKGEIILSKIDKKKRYIIFYKKTCSGCHQVMEFFDKENIRYDKYDLDTPGGLAMAGMLEVLSYCMKMVPVVVENNGE